MFASKCGIPSRPYKKWSEFSNTGIDMIALTLDAEAGNIVKKKNKKTKKKNKKKEELEFNKNRQF